MRSTKRTGRPETAVRLFRRGWNCSQAVLSAFAPRLGLDARRARLLAQAFGAGLARRGETCGAVTGALMAIGLKYGKTRADDSPARDKTYDLARTLMERFRSRHGALSCRALLGHDIATARGRKKIEAAGLHDTLCPRLVRSAASLLDRLL
ncbi:MAG: C_GCAxxG_C_C family protein [Candidatus Aminicenantes bacterium]|nr:C_GCAxxG_C_C family protein [Candidatus Aminicenantes bacterium]